jgi:hypothetical protein
MLSGTPSLREVNLENTDLSNLGWRFSIFVNHAWIEEVNMSWMKLWSVTSFETAFRNTTSLKEINLDNL